MKPFRVSSDWIDYAHSPGADDGQPTAVEICDMLTQRDYILVPAHRIDLVQEIISVAELYTGGRGEDGIRSATATRLIRRAHKWIGDAK